MRSKPVALGGILAALAVVIMSMGTILPVATYAAPMLCVLICKLVLKSCGKRIAWAWFAAVALLSLLLAPDKEAALVFVALGYYPIIRPRLRSWLGKALYFNASVLALYGLMLYVLGLGMEDTGPVLGILTLVLGNVVFFLLDILLERKLF